MPAPRIKPIDQFLDRIAGVAERWMTVQERYALLAERRFEHSLESYEQYEDHRMQQKDRHLDIQVERLKLQRAKLPPAYLEADESDDDD